MATVSVIIPAYNAERYLGELLECLERQSLHPAEVLVVDDGSTDRTCDVASRFGQVTLLRQDNRGVSAARNLAFSRAKGEYVAFLDADDLITDDYLERLASVAEREHADIVKCSVREYDDATGREIALHAADGGSVEFAEGRFHNFNYTVYATLSRMSFLKRFDIRFVEGENYAEDAPYGMLANALAEKVATVAEPLYLYRRHSGSTVLGVQRGTILPVPPFAGMKRALETYRAREKDPVKLAFFDYCVMRNLASFLTTQYMSKSFGRPFRERLCAGCYEIMDSFCPDPLANPFLSSPMRKNVRNHPLLIRAAVSVFARAYAKRRLYAFSSASAFLLRIIGKTRA